VKTVGLVIGQAASLIMKNHMDSHTKQVTNLLEQLSTGQKINSAADNPAGLAQVNQYDAQIRGMTKAFENIQQGISLLDTAESGLNTILGELQDFRETALEASADGISDYSAYETAASASKAAIDLVTTTTSFNGTDLLDGSVGGTFNIQAGPNGTANNSFNIASAINSNKGNLALGLATADLDDQANAQAAVTSIDAAIQDITDQLTVVGTYQEILASQGDLMTSMTVNYESARSTLMDVDVAEASAALTTYETLQQASATALIKTSSMQANLLSLLFN
jgi:flagellin